jgi:hypothetical protein
LCRGCGLLLRLRSASIGTAPARRLLGGLRLLEGELGFRQRRPDWRNVTALSSCFELVGEAFRLQWEDLATEQGSVNASGRGGDGRSRANQLCVDRHRRRRGDRRGPRLEFVEILEEDFANLQRNESCSVRRA